MKSNSKIIKGYRILIAILSVVLVLISSLMFTGSWFTHSNTIISNLDEPNNIISVKVDENDVALTDEIYITNSTWPAIVNKKLEIGFDSNVTKNVARIKVSFEWGTGTGEDFEIDEYYSLSNALTVNYTSNWVGSEEADEALEIGYPTYYYYNGVLNNNDEIIVFNSLSFSSKETDVSYDGKTIKISIYIETGPASDETLRIWCGLEEDEPLNSGSTETFGPTLAWVNKIIAER